MVRKEKNKSLVKIFLVSCFIISLDINLSQKIYKTVLSEFNLADKFYLLVLIYTIGVIALTSMLYVLVIIFNLLKRKYFN